MQFLGKREKFSNYFRNFVSLKINKELTQLLHIGAMSEQFEKFVKVLREMFMIDDAADLDFGIYKVMHQKQEDIEKYMKEDLQKNVQDEIAQNVGGRRRFVEEELQKAKQGALSLGVPMSDIMNVPRVKALVEELEGLTPTDELENMTYDHLARFFSRYYDDGDFYQQTQV